MFFDDEDEQIFFNNPELYHIVSRELYDIGGSIDPNPYGVNVPTHTEDGIPIRKLYVSNLPPKTTRTELFGIFAQYGFIKSCWLRMGERGPNKIPTPTYAFVTFSNPADAHNALQAPHHERCLRGRHLRLSPADSWHQPIQEPDGRIRWKVRTFNRPAPTASEEGTTSTSAEDTESTEQSSEQAETSSGVECKETVDREDTPESDESYGILEILNRDCLDHILAYVPIIDIIRSERVSKRWQIMVQEHLEGYRTFKTSWWEMVSTSLTTAVLRRLLQKLGGSLTRLHIDHHWSALNDRTAHIVGKFCPNLEDLKVVGMHTKNWNPLIYGCKALKNLKFVSCNKLTDASLIQIVKNDSSIESLMVANNTHVTGLFLTGSNPPKLNALSFFNCYSLQGTVLCTAIKSLPHLRTLRLDMCPASMWKIIPLILQKLPKLEELSLSDYMSVDCLYPKSTEFSDSIATLTELKVLNLSKNIYVTNAVLKQVAQSCPNLESLNISCCNPRKSFPGVSDESVIAVCKSCTQLQRLNVSYLAALTDAGLASAAGLPRLRALTARGNGALTALPIAACLVNCPLLEEVDLSGCDSVSEEVACAAVRALGARPRRVALHLAGTAAAQAEKEIPTHILLTINTQRDLSDTYLRPDFTDPTYGSDSSEDSFDDLYDHPAFNDYFEAEDELFLGDEDYEEYDGIAYGLHGPDIILL